MGSVHAGGGGVQVAVGGLQACNGLEAAGGVHERLKVRCSRWWKPVSHDGGEGVDVVDGVEGYHADVLQGQGHEVVLVIIFISRCSSNFLIGDCNFSLFF